MIEIRLHGRGGQGAVLAGNIVATALAQEGRHVVAIPSFGFERRGAPVASFLRFDDREIRQMTNIYAPDCVLCIDPTVGRAVNIFDGVKEQATWVQMHLDAAGGAELPRQDRHGRSVRRRRHCPRYLRPLHHQHHHARRAGQDHGLRLTR